MDVFRVATLNLFGHHADWPRRRDVLRTEFLRLRPDLVALQETVETAYSDQASEILGEGYHLVRQPGATADGCGASLASRWPLGEVRHVDLHVTERVDAAVGWIGSATLAEVEAPEPIGRLLFVHHKPSWEVGLERERELQAVTTARAVLELAGDTRADGSPRHVILAGDFDATPDSASVRFWTGRQSLDGLSVCYRDAWESLHPVDPGYTFTPRNRLVLAGDMAQPLPRRIDYIMVRCGPHGPTAAIVACSLFGIGDATGPGSDHYGVVAELAVGDG
ncbi:MAG: endonuclease/exonuclease/phosphatase family protein [Hamadaea sp.]|uniref:endonuclease/exonuclease/phosphatase family protein n=1 Tax=Hamadaea sp. TaxID=2024425 RepID=UPI00181B9297|nr:endonuclease/exonuclease/phosphatase family protein [Hamadaea sp.]NUR72762.1 endonuclease/exonuclease/phosphatase family protein [Hamadaea sp.]NUT22890.1 endonuclease/exonuclease/phosphatase family protein [Hamadaea sp.]